MDGMARTIREVCRTDAYGGRVQVVPSFNALLGHDVAHVPPELFEKLRGARIEIISESTSLNGFVMRVTKRRDKSIRVILAWVVISWLFYLVSSRIHGSII